jgi:uncharacterized protein
VSITFRDNADEHRYEALDDDEVVAVSIYELGTHEIALEHTEVAEDHGGLGLAEAITVFALTDARERGLGVLPYCPYVREYINDHQAEWLDLVPSAKRDRFDWPA